jgi:hypothetical protein
MEDPAGNTEREFAIFEKQKRESLEIAAERRRLQVNANVAEEAYRHHTASHSAEHWNRTRKFIALGALVFVAGRGTMIAVENKPVEKKFQDGIVSVVAGAVVLRWGDKKYKSSADGAREAAETGRKMRRLYGEDEDPWITEELGPQSDTDSPES